MNILIPLMFSFVFTTIIQTVVQLTVSEMLDDGELGQIYALISTMFVFPLTLFVFVLPQLY